MGNEIFIKNARIIDLKRVSTRLQTFMVSLILERSFYYSLKVFVERLS